MQAAFKKHAVSLTKHFFQMQVIAAAQPHHTRQTDPNCNFGFSVLLWCSHALGKCGLFEIVEKDYD